MITNTTTETTDDMVEQLSEEAKHMLLLMGMQWREMTGNAASYVDQGLLFAIYGMAEPWTMNKLKTTSSFGMAGIKYGVLPTFTRRGLLISRTSSNKTYYELSEPGREILRIMLLNCTRCNNTRVCQRCDGHGLLCEGDGQPSICEHTDKRDCTTCKGTGLDSDNMDGKCWECDDENDTCTSCNENRIKYCYYCSTHRSNSEHDNGEAGVCTYCDVTRMERH